MLKKLRLSEWIAGLSALVLFAGSGALSAQNKLEPTAPPGPTMKTLDEIPPTWSQVLPAAQRFQLVLGGDAVLDKETGLVWQKNPEPFFANWDGAHFFCLSFVIGGRAGWRLPKVEELASLLDPTQNGPALPAGHPFVGLALGPLQAYWSATTSAGQSTNAHSVNFGSGGIQLDTKAASKPMWCVRGGQGADPH